MPFFININKSRIDPLFGFFYEKKKIERKIGGGFIFDNYLFLSRIKISRVVLVSISEINELNGLSITKMFVWDNRKKFNLDLSEKVCRIIKSLNV